MIVYVYPFRGVCLDDLCHHVVCTKIASMTIFTSDNLVYTGCLYIQSHGLSLYLSHTCIVIYTLQARIAVRGFLSCDCHIMCPGM